MWKVAIVDDEPATREGLLHHVPWESLGITEARAAASGVEMLALCEAMWPDIVISDVRMPGITLCRRIRAMHPKCRIIFLSGYSDKEYLLSAIEISAVSYVEKPVDIEELSRVLRRAVAECEELRQGGYAAEQPVLLVRFAVALASGSREAVLDVAEALCVDALPSQTDLQVLQSIYFGMACQIEQRVRPGWDDEKGEALREHIAACVDAQALHMDLLARIDRAFPIGCQGTELSATVREVIRFMEQELSNERLTIDLMARQVYLAPTYLANLFKKEAGQTIGRFLLELRMRRAKELLSDRALRMYQVAGRIGYADPNYFAKTFRRAVGVSPKEYREKSLS